jgi:hypothetical protein
MKIGDEISFEKNGVVYTERVESVHYCSGAPAVYRRLNRWQSFLRRLTPQRWRQPLLVRAAEPPSVVINGGGDPAAFGKKLAQIKLAVDGMNADNWRAP